MCLYLRDRPCQEEAIVIGIGEKSFTVLVVQYGIESRIFVDDMKDTLSSYDTDSKTITLIHTEHPDSIQKFDKMEISTLSHVVVHLSSVNRPNLDLLVQLVGQSYSDSST